MQRHLVLHMIGKLEKSRIGADSRDEVPGAFPPLAIRVLLISIVNNTCLDRFGLLHTKTSCLVCFRLIEADHFSIPGQVFEIR